MATAAQTQETRFVSYLRVSTTRQGASGLGLEAQRETVLSYLNGGDWTLLAEFVEVESGKQDDRPKLREAIRYAKATGARLVVSKLDRLSRDAAFLLSLQKEGVDFVVAESPDINRLTVGVLALVAEQEREAISKRTKEALQAAKARGVQLGNPQGAEPLKRHIEEHGNVHAAEGARRKAQQTAEDLQWAVDQAEQETSGSLSAVAQWLNARGIRSPRGGRWTATSVKRLKQRLGAEAVA